MQNNIEKDFFLADDVGYLTDTQDDTDDEDNNDRFNKLSFFLYTVSRNNIAIRDYFNMLGLYEGFFDMRDVEQLEEEHYNDIYNLLNKKQKKDMKKNYLYTLRQLLHNPDFDLTTVGGKSRKYRKYKKSRKSRKSRKVI